MPHSSTSDRLQPALLAVAVAALLIAAVASGAFDSASAWTLIAGLGALFILSRGLGRARLPGGRRAHGAHEAGAPVPRAHDVVAPAADQPAVHAPPPAPDVPARPETEITLSEEQLRVDRREVPSQRVRLVRHVVTEMVTIQVPVRREEVRLERLPLHGDVPAPPDGEVIQELILRQEEPVVDKQVVARERVVLDKDVHTESRHVAEQVRREEVELEQEPTTHPTDQEIP